MAPFMLNSHLTGWPKDSQSILIIICIPLFMHNIYIYFAFFQFYFGFVAKAQPPKLTSHLRRLLMPFLAELFRLFLYTIYLFMMKISRILLRISHLEKFSMSCLLYNPASGNQWPGSQVFMTFPPIWFSSILVYTILILFWFYSTLLYLFYCSSPLARPPTTRSTIQPV